MKNKKGFTLIELLAVIVVLAIIALIATPIVMNTIKNAKKGAAERTADNYIKQVETTIAEKKLENNPLADGAYDIDENGNLTGNGLTESVTIDMNGTKPSGGTVKIKNSEVLQDGTKLVVGDYNVKYKNNKLTANEPYKGVLCKANTTKATALVYNGGDDSTNESSYTREEVGVLASEATSKYDVGVTYTCELGDGEQNTFYVLETNGDNVSLIAAMNLGVPVAWITKEDYLAAGGTENDYGSLGNNNLGPITVNKILKERTSIWTKLDEDQIKLPSGNQIATAGGDTKWTENNYTGTTLQTWLNSYTKFTTGTLGYWTSSSVATDVISAWDMRYDNILHRDYVSNSSSYGIRPVITISKSNLS